MHAHGEEESAQNRLSSHMRAESLQLEAHLPRTRLLTHDPRESLQSLHTYCFSASTSPPSSQPSGLTQTLNPRCQKALYQETWYSSSVNTSLSALDAMRCRQVVCTILGEERSMARNLVIQERQQARSSACVNLFMSHIGSNTK